MPESQALLLSRTGVLTREQLALVSHAAWNRNPQSHPPP